MTLEITILGEIKIERTWNGNNLAMIRKFKNINDEWILDEICINSKGADLDGDILDKICINSKGADLDGDI